MKTYEINIKLLSAFGTLLKGDTLFGHICWQIAYDKKLFGETIDSLLKEYHKSPFLVVSSAYLKMFFNDKPNYILKRPAIPFEGLFEFKECNKKEIIGERKELKKKRWMVLCRDEQIENFKSIEYKNDKELSEIIKQSLSNDINNIIETFIQPHNTINRLTGTTGKGEFAPFSMKQEVYLPDIELTIFVGLDKNYNIEQVVEAMKRIGEFGYGRDASTGLGRFKIIGYEEFNLSKLGSENPNACYTLSPAVPEKGLYRKVFFDPFIRFGRHGDKLAKSKNPFKNPVIMADEGAILIPLDYSTLKKPYIGTAVTKISKVMPESVLQGYSLYIPVNVEV
jgi:CRISPR-associated protein Csm4